jgi:hypothetical protein
MAFVKVKIIYAQPSGLVRSISKAANLLLRVIPGDVFILLEAGERG